MTNIATFCTYRVPWVWSVFAQLCLFIKLFFYIYKYLGPDESSLLTFFQFPQVSNSYLISCRNKTGDKNYLYLCTYSFKRPLNDDKIFSVITK